MNRIQITYAPQFSPIAAGDRACKHEGPDSLCIGGRVERVGKRQQFIVDATVCMRCGRIKPIAGEYRHYWDALSRFWKKFGWNSVIGERLAEFADLGTGSEHEAFFALIHGISPDELAAHDAKAMTAHIGEVTAGLVSS